MRSRSMQKLTDQVKARWPGVVVYGIGDDEHKRSRSGHNEDDTPGSRPEQEDADTIREHRAIDVMLGPHFSRHDAVALVAALITGDDNQRRMLYVIFDWVIWSKNNDWDAERFTDDPHTDHIHISGAAADDDNTHPWDIDVRISTPHIGEENMKPVLCNLVGRASVWFKEPGQPLRALSNAWSIDALKAAGAVWVEAPSAEAIVDAFGAPAGGVDAVRKAG